MILDALMQRSKSKFFLKQRNKRKFSLLKKNLSDLTIPRKINKSNLAKNSLSSKNLKKESLLMKKKINFIIRQNPVNTTREMEKKFYLKNRKSLKNIDKGSELFAGVIKAREKLVKKIILDYKNIQSYDKTVLNNNKNNYNRNVEYLENQVEVKKNQRLKEDMKFNKLKNMDNRKYILEFYKKRTNSLSSSFFSRPKYKTMMKKPSLNYDLEKEKENKLEEKVNGLLLKKKYLNYKRLKENAKKFCESIRGLDLECKLYETINDSNSSKNIKQKIFFNSGNLDRIVKLECIKDGEYTSEDYEGNGNFLRKCCNEYNFYCDKVISGYFPSFVKKEGFLNRTSVKYANLQGKFFGLPV